MNKIYRKMGIKKDIAKLFPPTQTYTKIAALYKDVGDKIIYVDASNEIYRAMLGADKLDKLTDPDGNPTLHIKVIYHNILERIKCGISEFWIFDSPEGNIYKKEEIDARRLARETAIKKKTESSVKLLTSIADIDDEIEKLSAKLTVSHTNDVKYILDCFGVPWMDAPKDVEAEHLCAYFAEHNQGYVLTVDFDALVFGAPATIQRKKGTINGRKVPVFNVYLLADILENNKINMGEFRKICVILGCDWAPGTRGIGPKTVMAKYKKVTLTKEQEDAVKIFSAEINESILGDVVQNPRDLDALADWLINMKGFNRAMTEKQLKGLI